MTRRLFATVFGFVVILDASNVQTAPSPKNVFRRLSDGVQSTRCSRCQSDASLLRNRHRCSYADGRLYFLSLKGKRQPNFGSFHETALYGGYLSAYGVGENETDGNDASRSWTWSHTHFDAINKNENREDAFFVLDDTLFLLIYTRFENVTFRQLLAWRRRVWIDVPLVVDAASQFLDGAVQNGGLAWTVADDDTRRLYLTATDGWGRMIISKLDVAFDEQRTPTSASITRVASDDRSLVNSAGAVVALTHRSGRLFGFYGWQGCGFHWEKRRLMTVDLNSTSTFVDYVNVSRENESESPPWAFTGPALTERHGSDWLMIGGSVASGVTGTEFDGSVWTFNLDALRWRKSKRSKVPDHLNPYDLCSTVDSTGATLYLADFKNVYRASLDQLVQT